MTEPDIRSDELRSHLASVHARIDAACLAAGRPVGDVTLIAVTKFFPAGDVLRLAELGVTDFGENRDQEAAQKVTEFEAVRAGGLSAPVRWHFVGRLQTNKARSVARYADVVHSIDRQELVLALDRGVERAARPPLSVLLQVSLDGDTGRGGALASELAGLADQVAGCTWLRLAGLMAVAPLHADPDASFAALAELSAAVRAGHPDADMLSAGMSADLEAAIRHGATHLRIGTALLGRRTPTFR